MENKNRLPFANKDLGQHFLKDEKVIQNICSDFKDQADIIFEVGPGPGILTKHLCLHQKPFYVFEKDHRFPEILKEFLPLENIELGDATKLNWEEVLKTKQIDSHKKIWLVSNLPYNVSVPLFTAFLECAQIQFLTLMFQKEVAEKILNFSTNPKDHEMGSLMALAQTYFQIKLLCKVPPGAFVPAPKVDSAVLSFVRLQDPVIALQDRSLFESFLRTLFSQKRKQMGKVLRSRFSEEKIQTTLTKLNIDRTRRAETLTLNEVHALYRGFSENT